MSDPNSDNIHFTVPEFDPDLIEEYRKEFNAIDVDHNGYLDKKEFKKYLSDQGYKEKQIKITYKIVDVNHDHKIHFEEFAHFIQATVQIVEKNDVNAYLTLVFKSCDKNHNNTLNKKEFVRFMKCMDLPVGFFEKNKKFKEVDTDKSGHIEYDEIVNYYNFRMNNPKKHKK
ncbi:hypothetical protein M9Y10_043100 [Tritrichomonas musculus]|uniref:EF-hand domain-containing protein n=1 Tax=Tritrichomonas musculus TaxID=1915356 RepID=A0ABR2K0J4_9EUKA